MHNNDGLVWLVQSGRKQEKTNDKQRTFHPDGAFLKYGKLSPCQPRLSLVSTAKTLPAKFAE
jgi:hypothetical protein